MRSRGPNVRGKGGTNLKVLTHYFSKNVILIILSIWVIIRITSLLYDLNYREDNLLRREGQARCPVPVGGAPQVAPNLLYISLALFYIGSAVFRLKYWSPAPY